VTSTSYRPDGTNTTVHGEWHFAWIFGGFGVQDVLFRKGCRRRAVREYLPLLRRQHRRVAQRLDDAGHR
jgi:hypothetical protein